MTRDPARIAAIVVSFEPDAGALARLVEAVRSQVAHIVVVDNGTGAACSGALDAVEPRVSEVIRLGVNRGIGYAHNVGIRWAAARGTSHVLLLDQDSEPSADMVARLLAAEAAMLARGERVGAVGPAYRDPKVGRTWPFYAFGRFGVIERHCRGGCGEDGHIVPCDLLITSGALVRRAVLDETGPLCEEFFLEHVDTEWSLRARFHGFRLFGDCSATMTHSLGESVTRLPVTGRRVQLHQAYRYYYAFRNSVLLWRTPYAVLPWKMNELKRLVFRMAALGLLVPGRRERLRMMVLGLRDGLRGRTGRLTRD